MLLFVLENDQDFEYLNTPLLVSCPASGSDQGGLFLLDFKNFKNNARKALLQQLFRNDIG